MPNVHETLEALFTAVAGAIRAKDGTSAPIVADDFPDRIAAIPSGGQEIHFAPSDSTEYADIRIRAISSSKRIRIYCDDISGLRYPLAFSGYTDGQLFDDENSSMLIFLNASDFDAPNTDLCKMMLGRGTAFLEIQASSIRDQMFEFSISGSAGDHLVDGEFSLRGGSALIYV